MIGEIYHYHHLRQLDCQPDRPLPEIRTQQPDRDRGLDLSLTKKITLLLVLMVSSKGIAGVPRASLVVVAAVLPIFHLPEAGLLLILGVDHFLDMGRSATNVLGNCIATAVVAKWEGDLGEMQRDA